MKKENHSLINHVTLCKHNVLLIFELKRAMVAQPKMVSLRCFPFSLLFLSFCIKSFVGMRAKFVSLSLKADAEFGKSDF